MLKQLTLMDFKELTYIYDAPVFPKLSTSSPLTAVTGCCAAEELALNQIPTDVNTSSGRNSLGTVSFMKTTGMNGRKCSITQLFYYTISNVLHYLPKHSKQMCVLLTILPHSLPYLLFCSEFEYLTGYWEKFSGIKT